MFRIVDHYFWLLMFIKLSVHDFLDSLDELPLGWHIEGLVDVGERSVKTANTLWRSFEIEEALACDGSLEFSTEATGDWSFVSDNASASLAYRVANGLAIPWKNRDKIDHLDGDAELFFDDASDLKPSKTI